MPGSRPKLKAVYIPCDEELESQNEDANQETVNAVHFVIKIEEGIKRSQEMYVDQIITDAIQIKQNLIKPTSSEEVF